MKDSSNKNARRLIAQLAARLMADEGQADYAHAKRKAARQLGFDEDRGLPSNHEIEQELRLHHEIFHGEAQPQWLLSMRTEALDIMRLLDRFNPHLAGAVLDGTAGRYSSTEIHLFADSLKDVELFLLNQSIPYQFEERLYRIAGEKQRMPMFVLEGRYGPVHLVVFGTDDLRTLPRTTASNGASVRAGMASVAALVEQGA